MVGMIQINLLPIEYRTTDKPPIGLFLLGLAGVLFVFLSVAGWLFLKKENAKLKGTLERYKTTRQEQEQEVRNLQAKEAESEKARARLSMIMNISMSKIHWSQKLVEFGKIIAKHDVWVRSITLDEAKKKLIIACFCKGRDERKVVEFRKAILKSKNFYSIFKGIAPYNLRPTTINVPVKEENDQKNQIFTLEFELKQSTIATPPQKQ